MKQQNCSGELRNSRERGSAVIELALIVPLLTLIAAGTMEFSRVFYTATAVANAARAGVQYAVQDPLNATDYTGMQQAAVRDGNDVSGMTATASQFCQCPDGSAASCGSGGCSNKRTYVQVLTTATFNTMGTYPMVPNSVILNDKAVIRVK